MKLDPNDWRKFNVQLNVIIVLVVIYLTVKVFVTINQVIIFGFLDVQWCKWTRPRLCSINIENTISTKSKPHFCITCNAIYIVSIISNQLCYLVENKIEQVEYFKTYFPIS